MLSIRLAELNFNKGDVDTKTHNSGLDNLMSNMVLSTPSSYTTPSLSYGESHYMDIIKRKVKLYDYSFDAAHAAGTQFIVANDVFFDYLSSSSGKAVGHKLDDQMFFSGDLTLTFTMQGAPQAYGQLVFYAVPVVGPPGVSGTGRRYPLPGMVKAKTLPHVVMDPSKSCTCELTLPCPTPNGVWNRTAGVAGTGNSYMIVSVVYNALGSGTATAITAVEGQIYASFRNMTPGPLVMLSDSLQEEEIKEGPLSSTASAVATAAGALSNVPVIGPYATVTSEVASASAEFLKWMGFSRPLPLNSSQMVPNKTTTTYGSYNSQYYGTNLATDTANSISISPTYYNGGSMEDMDIAHICTKKSLIAQATIAPSNLSGGVLATIPVTPSYCMEDSTKVELTNLAFMAWPFKFWHGDITYTFEVVCSTFHRCVIGVCHQPGSLTGFAWEDAVQTLRNKIINVSGNTVFEFEAPWQQNAPFEPVRDPGATGISGNNGYIRMYLLTPLESNGSTDSIVVNIYAHSNNIKFAFPDASDIENANFAFAEIDTLTMLSDSGDLTLLSDCEMVNTPVPDSFGRSKDDDFFLRFYGEDVAQSVKKMAAKATICADLTGANSFHQPNYEGTYFDYAINFRNSPGWLNDGTTRLGQKLSLFDYYAIGYKGVRGSVNISMVPLRASPSNTGINFFWLTAHSGDHKVPVPRDNYPFSRNISIGYPQIHPSNDITIPFYQGLYFNPTYTSFPNTQGLGAAFGHEGLSGEFFCLKSLGEDGAYVQYLGPPILSLL